MMKIISRRYELSKQISFSHLQICSVELMQQHFPGKKVEEYRRMLGSFGVIGDLALQQVIFLSKYSTFIMVKKLKTVQDFFVGADNHTGRICIYLMYTSIFSLLYHVVIRPTKIINKFSQRSQKFDFQSHFSTLEISKIFLVFSFEEY